MKKSLHPALLAVALTMAAGHAAFADAPLKGDPSEGQSLFQEHCMACHSLTSNRVGPMLGTVYGRKAGTAPDFNYSSAVKSSGVVWSEATLSAWLTSPQKLIPGQRMNFSIGDPQKRADIIAYLKSLAGKGGQ